MASLGMFLFAALVGGVYLAVILATLDGAVRAFRQRYMPPWVVGLIAVALLIWFHELLGAPLGNWGGLLAVTGGIVAGAAYGLRRRRTSLENPSARKAHLFPRIGECQAHRENFYIACGFNARASAPTPSVPMQFSCAPT